jgi:hypothetical protein
VTKEEETRVSIFCDPAAAGYVSFALRAELGSDQRFGSGDVSGSHEHYFCFRSAGQFWTRVSDCVLPSLGVTATNR